MIDLFTNLQPGNSAVITFYGTIFTTSWLIASLNYTQTFAKLLQRDNPITTERYLCKRNHIACQNLI